MIKLTVVIVNYNSTDFLHRCLDSLFERTATGSLKVVVVDNASKERDFSEIEARHPSVAIILNSRNLGFAVACNQAVQSSDSDFYLLLNPDCIVEEEAIDRCLNFLEQNSAIGIVGCRVTNPDGSLQLACRRQIPRPSSAFYRFIGLSRLFPDSARFAAYNLSHIDNGMSHEVEAVSGSFLMFRNQVYRDTDGLDERFFLYGEDLDFCYRASLQGWKVFYFADAVVVHYKNVSSRNDIKSTTQHFYSAMETFYRKHFYKNAGRLERLLVTLGIRLLYAAKRTRQILFGKSEIGSNW
jgi:GT2 family glycosyltransferase